MNNEDTFLLLCCGVVSVILLEGKKEKQERVWVREWVRRRKEEGCCAKLLKELRLETPTLYHNFLRMKAKDFDYLLNLVKPLITKQTTRFREPISATERLAVTLRYLATGESFRSLQFVFRIPFNTISVIVPGVCNAIYNVLQPEYLKVPLTDGYLEYTNFFNYQ
ncbi:uncharacterized protein LOC119610629, partial [Lucilia sericata]|uniref:uncharacterized protein LOC119610629 n=1 Tax=Lucilia sericata TaxID=13632 RepID=UPI0018A83313